VKILSKATFARLAEENQQRGKKARDQELNDLARSAGFDGIADALLRMKAPDARTPQRQTRPVQTPRYVEPEGGDSDGGSEDNYESPAPAVQAAGGSPGAAPRPPQGGKRDRKAWNHYVNEKRQWEVERAAYKARLDHERARARELQAQLDAKDTEMDLREVAVSCGVKDVPYAISLFTRDMAGKSDDELAKLDERTYFEQLRASKPYLFGEQVTRATTGVGAPPSNMSPTPAAVNAAATSAAHVDARAMSRTELATRLRKMGLNMPGFYSSPVNSSGRSPGR
jgi:hypothetical protein